MLQPYSLHNQFKTNLKTFTQQDPHLHALSQQKYEYHTEWWAEMPLDIPGIYILTGGRQIGKSTSCKLLIKHCLEKQLFAKENILYLPCDEIYDANQLSRTIRHFLDTVTNTLFLLIIDEVTFVHDWDRVIKALADEGHFNRGLCLLTGSDTLILKEAAMRFPGRRGKAKQTDFHLYPLSFSEYVKLIQGNRPVSSATRQKLFQDYLQCGGYLRAINDLAEHNEISASTFLTYQQWICGDFLKQGKSEETLQLLLQALLTVGVSQISFSSLTRKIGLISKDTCIDYCRLLERMDILINLQAFDMNKKQGFPRKDRKFHFTDPFIYQTLNYWLKNNGFNSITLNESIMVEACVASHCHRFGKTYYFKGQGEIDIIWLTKSQIEAIEIKWANQLRPHDIKMLKQFKNNIILQKLPQSGMIEDIKVIPVYEFLYNLNLSSSAIAVR